MTIILFQFKRFALRKGTILIILGLSIFTMLMYMGNNRSTITVGVVDYDQTVESKWLYRSINQVSIKKIDEEDIVNLLSKKKINISIVIPEGYSENILNNSQLKVEMIDDYGGNEGVIHTLNNRINILRTAKEQQQSILDLEMASVKKEAVYQRDYRSIERSISTIGILLMSIMYLANTLVSNLKNDKEENRIQRILVSPIKQGHYILQQITAFLMVIVLLVVAFFVFSMVVMGVDYGFIILPIILVITLFSILILMVAMIGLLLADDFKHMHSFVHLYIMAMVMIGGCLWPIEIMPEVMQFMAKFLPTYWTQEIIKELIISGGLSDSLPQLGALVSMTVIVFAIGSTKRVQVINK